MAWQVAFFVPLISYIAYGQIHYTIYEEMKQGSLVGNIADDLSLDTKELSFRRFHIVSDGKEQYFVVNLDSGNLYVKDRIDREVICGKEDSCFLNLEAVVANPLNVFHIKVEIQDINDNPPSFSKNVFTIEISEMASMGAHFFLGNAQDPDIGTNSLQSYKLSLNQHFILQEKTSKDGSIYPELVLQKPLDRENQSIHQLTLTAYDGGKPAKSGTASIKVIVQDANDNFPVFNQENYQIHLKENVPNNFLVLHLNATDEDEGSNAQIMYYFSNIPENAIHIFSINAQNGDIRIKGELDFEVVKYYEITVEAKDGGGLASHCKVSIQVFDVNDNAPEIIITSMSSAIFENSLSGTVVALINVRDQDSGVNSKVTCEIIESVPFQLITSSSNYYKLITKSTIDRETVSNYNITIRATDKGSPPLSTDKMIHITIADLNDNPPVFEKTNYIVYIPENNPPGTKIHSVHATDLDLNENAQIIYSILSNKVANISVSSFVSINSVTGVIYAQGIFDYEILREFQFQVIVKDSGSPPLSTNVTVKICIIDMNDNSPNILYPSSEIEGTSLFEFIPRSSEKGYLVTKVIAVDADTGHNAWLSYHLLQVPESSFFIIGQHTGEIRIARTFQDAETLKQKVVVMVKDNGTPSLSATVTLHLVVGDNFQQALPELRDQPIDSDTHSNVTFYLVIAIALISVLFILTVIITIITKCRNQNTPIAFGTVDKYCYPQVDLRYPSVYSDGSLPLQYSYDVCVALDSSQNEFAYLKPIQNVPTETLIDTVDSATGHDSMKESLNDANLSMVR